MYNDGCKFICSSVPVPTLTVLAVMVSVNPPGTIPWSTYYVRTFKNSDLVRTRAYHLMFCSSVVEILAQSKGA